MTAMFVLLFMLPAVGLVIVVVPISTLVLLSGRLVSPSIRPRQLLYGYVAAVTTAVVVAALLSYTSFGGSESAALDTPETYSRELWINFQIVADMTVLYTLLGISTIVAPIVFAMTRRGFRSSAWVLAVMVPVSLATAPLLLVTLHGAVSLLNVSKLLAVNLVLALAFSLGLGMPIVRTRAKPTSILG